MQNGRFVIPLMVPGTLTANITFEFKAPFDFTIENVSAQASNTTSFILDIGTIADTDAYLDGVTVTGATGVATEYDRDDFVGEQYPHIAADTQCIVSIDYDGGAGGDSAGISLLITCAEG